MARIVVICSLFFAAACDVGELPGLPTDSGTGEMGGNGCVNIAATADIPAGHHNPPMAATGCMSAAGCHNQAQGLGTGAPAFSYGGMLYKADKTTPFGGATITVKLGTAEKRTVVSDNGEFYMVPGAAGIEPPTTTMTATTSASGCPDILPMAGALVAGGGDCNKGGCHTKGTGQDAIHLP